MYDELVKALRFIAKQQCRVQGEQTTICAIAADAIEELQQAAEHYHGCMNEWFEAAQEYKAAVPKWIPVAERLPENGEYVLVRYKNNDMAVACVFDRDENFTFWRAQTDEGWCADCDTEPTHWMPLPEPPKEE